MNSIALISSAVPLKLSPTASALRLSRMTHISPSAQVPAGVMAVMLALDRKSPAAVSVSVAGKALPLIGSSFEKHTAAASQMTSSEPSVVVAEVQSTRSCQSTVSSDDLGAGIVQ